jgi:hypothetical protein
VRRSIAGAVARGSVVVGLVVVAVVHLNLYLGEGYRHIPTIGWLFLLTVVSAFGLALATAVSSRPVLELAAAGLALGVLGGYVLTLALPMGLFSFREPGISYSGGVAIAAEVLVAAVGLREAWRGRQHPLARSSGCPSRTSAGPEQNHSR